MENVPIRKATLNDKYKTLYFGSKHKIVGDSIQLQNDELFVTPFITLASIFAVRPRGAELKLPRGSYNYGYDEWSKPIKVLSQETEPLKEVHIVIEGLPELEPFDYPSSGFIYVIDAKDVKDHLYQKQWMDDRREYIVKDLESVPIQQVIPVDAVCHIRGGDKMSEPVTEAFFKEAYLKAKEKEKLKDSAYGIPELRKFPLTNKNGEYDENHIRMAVKFFGSAPKKYKKELARRILRAAHSIDLDTEKWDTINNALKKESHVNEYVSTILEYVSSKQRNREKKFLKERNFVPDKDNPNKGWIDSDFKDKNGKPKRIRFEINNDSAIASTNGEDRIQMTRKALRTHPGISSADFKHEEGHMFAKQKYKEWAKTHPKPEDMSLEDHMNEFYKSGEFKDFFAGVVEDLDKAVEKGMSEHGKNLEEYFADAFALANSLNESMDIKSVRTMGSRINSNKEYSKLLNRFNENIDNITHYVAKSMIATASNDLKWIKDCPEDIRNNEHFKKLRKAISDCQYYKKLIQIEERTKEFDRGIINIINSSLNDFKDTAKLKQQKEDMVDKLKKQDEKIQSMKAELKVKKKFVEDCKKDIHNLYKASAATNNLSKMQKEIIDNVKKSQEVLNNEIEFRAKMLEKLSGEMKSRLKQEAAVSGGAYTSKGINWANVQPVTMVYKRFSTKNREQMEPIKRFWEISDKYFPEPSMTSGFGWDWTGWETDFAYGIIINDKKVPPEFMEELKQEFPDIILDENFLIPINYEEVYECSFEEMDATYDKIWSKGFLECEYEQYPALGRMKISVIYKKDADKLNSDIAKYIKTVPTVKGYRFTLQDKNVGIYEELKRIMYNETNSPDTWEAFKKSPACSWLPSPPSYGENNKSYFTKLGYDKFMSDTWPVLTKYINDDTIDCEEVDIPVTQIVYQDDYQFITGSPLEESNTERKNFIMKEQITKILEAYNSGVLTQEEASEKIEAIQEEYTPNSDAENNKAEEVMESAIMNNLRAKQEKIMESYKMGIINGTEGMRLIERVMMEADYITEEEDTAYEGDDNDQDITPADTDGDTSDSDDSNIESLADYINSLDASERADLLAKINTDVATAGDADSSDDIENTDDATADDLTPPDGETEEPTSDGDTDAEPEVETESAKTIKEPDERLINAYKNVSLDDMEV